MRTSFAALAGTILMLKMFTLFPITIVCPLQRRKFGDMKNYSARTKSILCHVFLIKTVS